MHPDPNFDIGRFLGDPETGRGALLGMAQAVGAFSSRHATSIITAVLTAAAVAGLQYLLVIPRIEEREIRSDARLTKLEVRAGSCEADEKRAEILIEKLNGTDQLMLERLTSIDRRLDEHSGTGKKR